MEVMYLYEIPLNLYSINILMKLNMWWEDKFYVTVGGLLANSYSRWFRVKTNQINTEITGQEYTRIRKLFADTAKRKYIYIFLHVLENWEGIFQSIWSI